MNHSNSSQSGTDQFLSISIEKPHTLSSTKKNAANSLSSVYQSFQRSSIALSKDDRRLSSSNLITQANQQLLNDTTENNMKNVLKFLDENENLNLMAIRDDKLQTLLHHAAANNNAFMFQTFINFQTKYIKNKQHDSLSLIKWLNQQDKDGNYCIHFAALKGNRQIIDVYFGFGCDINVKNTLGLTLIHIAAQSNQYVFMVYLKEKYKVDIFHQDHRQSTALHQACFFGSENCIDFLISWGLNVNHQDNDGCIPLHLAIREDRRSIIKKLLWKGSDAKICNNRGLNALEISEEEQKEEIRKLLKKSISIQCKMAAASYQRSRSWAKFIFHVLIFLVVVTSQVTLIFPFIHPWETWLLIGIQSSVVIFFLISYSMNPGFAIKQGEERRMLDLVQQYPIEEICVYCRILRPQRSKHCEICQRCIELYDHHCPWINNCVGSRNLLAFYIYLWCLEIAILSQVITSIQIISYYDNYSIVNEWYKRYEEWSDEQRTDYHKKQLIILSVLGILCLLLLIQLSSLIKSITQNLLKGITAYEKLLNRVSFSEKQQIVNLQNCREMFFYHQKFRTNNENNLL